MTKTKSKGFPTLEAETQAELYDHIHALTSEQMNEEFIVDEWIRINKSLYFNYNPDADSLMFAMKIDDIQNEHQFNFSAKTLLRHTDGDPESLLIDNATGRTLGVKYVGRRLMRYAKWSL